MVKVVRFYEFGGPEVLRLEDHDPETPGPGEVLIDVEAIGLNRSEVNFRRDRYFDHAQSLPAGLGYEGAGRVRAAGADVDGWLPGDAVSVIPLFKQSRYPMYGEQAIVPAKSLVARPSSVSAVTGAAMWMPYLTAYGALVDIGRLRAGDHVIISAASTSVGLAAIQVAVRAGAVPVALTQDPTQRQRLLDAGAAHVLVAEHDDTTTSILDLTRGKGAEMVFDAVAGPGVEALAAATAQDGVIFIHGGLSGQPTPLPGLSDMRPIFTRPYMVFEITGNTERLARAQRYVTTGITSGALTPTIDSIFELDDIVEAHRRLESGTQFGKIVVTTTKTKD